MDLEILLNVLTFILVGLMLVSFFLVWRWFDAKERLKVVREVTREQTVHAIRHAHNKCRILLYISFVLALCYIPLPILLHQYYGTLAYPGVVILADTLMLLALRQRAKDSIASIDEYVNANEEHVREAAAERERQREECRSRRSWRCARVVRTSSSSLPIVCTPSSSLISVPCRSIRRRATSTWTRSHRN